MASSSHSLVTVIISGEDIEGFQCSKSGGGDYTSNRVAPDAVESNLSFGYSGRHDHGKLAQLKEGGHYGDLIGALHEMKSECDRFLQVRPRYYFCYYCDAYSD
jgi:hypothetical protein